MQVQQEAFAAITAYLAPYEVETKGVYIQDVEFPAELVIVLTKREIANQEKATFAEAAARPDGARRDGKGQGHRRHAGAARAVAGRRSTSRATRPTPAKQARGEAAFVELTGKAEAAKTEAIGLAEAKAVEALGLARARRVSRRRPKRSARCATALVAVANAVAEGHITVVPEVLVTGGGAVRSKGSRPR